MRTMIDLFSGIGGFHLGFERAGFRCIGSCENDKFALESYKAMFDTKGEWFCEDIRSIKSKDIPYQTAGPSAFLARISQLPAFKKESLRKEADYILQSLTSSRAKKKKISPDGLSLKTLKTCYPFMTDGTLPEFSLKWMKQGTTSSGRCSIPKTTGCPNQESASSLLDILEQEVDLKYYLSREKTMRILEGL